MRNPLARLVHRNPEKPTLRERAAALKATAASVMRRKPMDDRGRSGAPVGGEGLLVVAAAIPLPVLASQAMASPALAPALPHPDQALFDAEAEYLRTIDAEKAADAASAKAHDAFWEALGPCPDGLLVRGQMNGLITFPGQPLKPGRGPTVGPDCLRPGLRLEPSLDRQRAGARYRTRLSGLWAWWPHPASHPRMACSPARRSRF